MNIAFVFSDQRLIVLSGPFNRVFNFFRVDLILSNTADIQICECVLVWHL